MKNFADIGSIIGRAVISVETANRLGVVSDLIVDPHSGQLAGLVVEGPDQSHSLVSIIDLHGIGPHAVMIDRDALFLSPDSQLNQLPKARNDIIGVKVLTDHGQLLGKISRVFLCLTRPYVFFYEVRSSILDKLLRHALFFAASLGGALSGDGSAFVVNGDNEKMAHSLDFAARSLPGFIDPRLSQPSGLRIEVRTRTQ
jgi:uncharacterized protein YrrD